MTTVWMWLALAVAGADPLGPWEGDGAQDSGVLAWPACDAERLTAPVQHPADADLYRLANPDRSWGTELLVDTLVTAVGEVVAEHPHVDPVFIGDLSWRRGGPMPPHNFHRYGRDADVGLFTTGGVQPTRGFRNIAPSELDAEATWALIEALLDTGAIESILLDRSLIRELKRWLREHEVLTEAELRRIFPAPGTERPWVEPGIVRHVARHRNHLHIRVRCD